MTVVTLAFLLVLGAGALPVALWESVMFPQLVVAAVVGLFGPEGFEMPPSAVVLDGEKVAVSWNDADSFEILEGRYRDARVRLMGYNALESYGPVHQWGEWTPMELFKLTKEATKFARSRVWNCHWSKEKDHYGRLLIVCPDLIRAMVAEGYGHLFAFDEPVDPEALKAQRQAIREKKGMWAKGVPKGILTSVHSADEKRGDPYNRLADPRTGRTRKRKHHNAYKVCEKVCMEGSCLIYVPFGLRYGPQRAECLKTKGKW